MSQKLELRIPIPEDLEEVRMAGEGSSNIAQFQPNPEQSAQQSAILQQHLPRFTQVRLPLDPPDLQN